MANKAETSGDKAPHPSRASDNNGRIQPLQQFYRSAEKIHQLLDKARDIASRTQGQQITQEAWDELTAKQQSLAPQKITIKNVEEELAKREAAATTCASELACLEESKEEIKTARFECEVRYEEVEEDLFSRYSVLEEVQGEMKKEAMLQKLRELAIGNITELGSKIKAISIATEQQLEAFRKLSLIWDTTLSTAISDYEKIRDAYQEIK